MQVVCINMYDKQNTISNVYLKMSNITSIICIIIKKIWLEKIIKVCYSKWLCCELYNYIILFYWHQLRIRLNWMKLEEHYSVHSQPNCAFSLLRIYAIIFPINVCVGFIQPLSVSRAFLGVLVNWNVMLIYYYIF